MPATKKSLLITLDFPPNHGGVAAYYQNLCNNSGPGEVVVMAPSQKGDEEFDAHQHFPVIRSDNLKRLLPGQAVKFAARLSWLKIIKEIDHIVRCHNIEVLQIGQVLPLGALAMIYNRRRHIPFIFYAHGMDVLIVRNFWRKKILLKKIIWKASAIVANSHFTKDLLLKAGADPRLVYVVYPCPNTSGQHVPDDLLENFLKKHELEEKKILLTVGRLVERKGHDVVIKAMPDILKRVPDAVYAIVGDGPYQKSLRDLAHRLKLGHHVRFYGSRPAADIPFFYQAANVFIMPSRQLANGDVEGFGIVYLEANLYGKPVIGGKSGGIPEAVVNGLTGLLVDPKSERETAKTAIMLLTDQAYAHRLGFQGLNRVLEDFDWRTQTEKIHQIINNL